MICEYQKLLLEVVFSVSNSFSLICLLPLHPYFSCCNIPCRCTYETQSSAPSPVSGHYELRHRDLFCLSSVKQVLNTKRSFCVPGCFVALCVLWQSQIWGWRCCFHRSWKSWRSTAFPRQTLTLTCWQWEIHTPFSRSASPERYMFVLPLKDCMNFLFFLLLKHLRLFSNFLSCFHSFSACRVFSSYRIIADAQKISVVFIDTTGMLHAQNILFPDSGQHFI